MKKIIITICLLALVVVSAVPVFAAVNSGTLSINGVSVNVTFIEPTWDSIMAFNSAFTIDLEDMSTILYEGHYLMKGTSLVRSSHPVDFNGNYYYDGFVAPSPTTCDGSTCPATDANRDNVCDDCGMTFAFLRDYDTWPDPYSVWTESKQETFPYCIMYEDVDGNKNLVMSATRAYYGMDMIVIPDADSGTTYVRYTIFDDSWRLANSYSEGTGIISGRTYSSYNIFNADDTLVVIPQATDFFPTPLWMIPSQVTQGETVLESVAETGTILVLCGVGLMACLMVFVLFSRVLPIFLR